MCFGCPKEPSHQDRSLEYPQHMFWLRNKKNNFQLHTLIWGPELSSGARVLNFDQSIHPHLKFICASSKGSSETAGLSQLT